MLDLPKCWCLKLESKSKKKPSFRQQSKHKCVKNENFEDLDLEAHNVRSGAKPRMYSRNVCLKNKALSHDFYPHLFSLYISFSGVLATPQVQGNLEVKWLVPPSCDYLSTLFFLRCTNVLFCEELSLHQTTAREGPVHVLFRAAFGVQFMCVRLLSFVFSQLCSMESSNFWGWKHSLVWCDKPSIDDFQSHDQKCHKKQNISILKNQTASHSWRQL